MNERVRDSPHLQTRRAFLHSNQLLRITMTVLYGSIKGSEDGWTFCGEFGPRVGPPTYKIKGGLNHPVHHLHVPHAELVNAAVGPYSYHGEIGPRFLSLRSSTLPEVILLGKLDGFVEPTSVAGWLQVAEA
ncbi:hypothetical protein APHAL10511_005298 [Amanita phalloides]|nr:hypothetical protein APHAL10511_005298 [Amanita phalloides]